MTSMVISEGTAMPKMDFQTDSDSNIFWFLFIAITLFTDIVKYALFRL